MKDREEHDGPSVRISFKDKRLPLVIAFAGLGGNFQFVNTLASYDVNVIFLRDLKRNWYLNGIPGAGETVSDIVEFLKNEIEKAGSNKVIAIGASAGAYAALLYGARLQADTIIAFSPQTFLGPLRRILYLDYRWKTRMKQIYEGRKKNEVYYDLKPWLKQFNGEAKLLYDASHRLDRFHAARLKQNNIEHIRFAIGGHGLVKYLKESGELKTLLATAL
jgi:pimeloyl-ACP methyl ester carboxylesterase